MSLSKIIKFIAYIIIAVLVIFSTEWLIGFLLYDDYWIYKADRLIMFTFVFLNIYVYGLIIYSIEKNNR